MSHAIPCINLVVSPWSCTSGWPLPFFYRSCTRTPQKCPSRQGHPVRQSRGTYWPMQCFRDCWVEPGAPHLSSLGCGRGPEGVGWSYLTEPWPAFSIQSSLASYSHLSSLGFYQWRGGRKLLLGYCARSQLPSGAFADLGIGIRTPSQTPSCYWCLWRIHIAIHFYHLCHQILFLLSFHWALKGL